MEARRWRQVTQLFEELLEQPPEQRSTLLEKACAGDQELRRAVEDLLTADAEAGTFLAEPPVRPAEPHPAEPRSATPTKIGRYEIVEKIAEGGFGEVFLGTDTMIRRQVAIKTCKSTDEDLRRRFLREAEVAGRLEHPHIAAVFDAGFDGETPFLVQEYLAGEDLEAQIRERRPATLAERLTTLLGIARGLEYAQARDVIHRDVKPSNIRLPESGGVKLLDFGIAHLANARTRLTRTGTAMGTLAYMAPEQLRGEEVDGRADQFAFGVVAYELLSYHHPFAAASDPATLYRLLDEEPVPLSKLDASYPRRLDRLVRRCLAKEPDDRFADFTALIGELEAIAAELPAEPIIPSTPTAATLLQSSGSSRRRSGARRRRGAWLAAAVVASLAAALVVWMVLDEPDPVAVPEPAPGGQLVIDAQPWAEIVEVAEATGRERVNGAGRYTPLTLTLAPGRYQVTLRHPEHDDPYVCRVAVVSGEAADCRADFVRRDARSFFAEAGW